MDFLLYIFLEGLMRMMGLRVQSKRDLVLGMGISSLGDSEKELFVRRVEFGMYGYEFGVCGCEFGVYGHKFGLCGWQIYLGAQCTSPIRAP
jgi:hypothetical protein